MNIVAMSETMRTRAVIFDIDGTLVEPWTTKPLPGRIEQLQQLKKTSLMLFGATNQGGPAWHLWHRINEREDADKYPDLIQIISQLSLIRSLFGLHQICAALHPGQPWVTRKIRKRHGVNEDSIYSYEDGQIIMCWNQSWRKPRAGMIDYIRVNSYLDRRECLFVGNEPSDAEAAREAGIRYMQESEFFYQPAPVNVCKIGSTYIRDDHDECNSKSESSQP